MTAIIWDAESGQELLRLVGHTGSVNDAAWNPDGSQVITASNDRTVRLWDVITGQELHQFIGHNDEISLSRLETRRRRDRHCQRRPHLPAFGMQEQVMRSRKISGHDGYDYGLLAGALMAAKYLTARY